jgi:glycosyltransferase involved in cell wall biosynthesis
MDIKKIKIGFIGSMNAMPMQYALKFKEEGFDVKYIVESTQDNKLMRPETYFKKVSYPYPNWIKEIFFKKTMLKLFFSKFFTRELRKEMNDCDVIFFNHYGHHVSRHFDENKVIKIALFSGADLDGSASYEQVKNSINKKNNIIVGYLKKKLLEFSIYNYRKGIRSCHILSYFPAGMNVVGDKLLEEIMQDKPFVDIRRYDANFEDVGLKFVGPTKNEKLVIFSAVRFLIKTTEQNAFEYKGNDLIIKAIAQFYKVNQNIEVHFVEKGESESLEIAKQMCIDLGIDEIVTWHQPMPLEELLDHYEQSDILFDQVGTHWLGGVGMYAAYMGKPLIANARLDVFGDTWGDDVPILDASTVDDIFKHLVACQNHEYRKQVGEASHLFMKEKLDGKRVCAEYKSEFLKLYVEKENRSCVV